jgi:hypothetical protein
MKFRLSPFAKIASTRTLSIPSIQEPNPVLNVGLFNENMGSVAQVNFLNLQLPKISNYNGVDTSYNSETGKGSIYIPDNKEFYEGEPL